MLVRREQAAEIDAVRKVVGLAFARPEAADRLPVEVALLDELRADDGWLPALSFVAVAPDEQVIGHVVCTRGSVATSSALGLGPLAVRPDRQGQGVGQALMHTVLGAADALGEPLVALLGEPGYYRRFGFRPAARYGIAAPDPQWGDYFQVRTLSAYQATRGTFTYAEPFARLSRRGSRTGR